MKFARTTLVLGIILAIFVSGCSMKSEKEAINDAKNAAEIVFKADNSIKPNHDLENFSFYLPDRLEVKEAAKSNVILHDNDQLFIVFYNKLEKPNSKLNFQSVKKDSVLLLESFSDKNKFGYISIFPDEGKGYLMQIGIGGVKTTTYTSTGNMAEDAEDMMKIAKSIVMRQGTE